MLLESIPHHVWSFRTDGTVGYWNRQLVEYTGLTDQQLHSGGWDALHPDDAGRVQQAWQEAFSRGSSYEVEQRVRGRDGKYRRFLSRGVPVPDQQGRLTEWFGTDTDIEDRRLAEEELHNAEAELAHITRVTTMGELSASIAHELNQPLTAIGMDGNACLQWLNRPVPNLEEAREAAARVVNQGTRANQIIARIRSLMQNRAPEISELNMNVVINDVSALTRHQFMKHDVILRTTLSPELRSVRGDGVRLQQVLVNLLMNAVEAISTKGEGTREVLVRSENRGADEILVSVRDSGVGLNPAKTDEIFKPFVTTKPGGMGMGLSISNSIIRAHGGRLWALPNNDQGSTFQFFLPETGRHVEGGYAISASI
jgi:PAS domain S-box-containing protein